VLAEAIKKGNGKSGIQQNTDSVRIRKYFHGSKEADPWLKARTLSIEI